MKDFHPENYHPNVNLWEEGQKTSAYKTPIFELVSVPKTSPDKTISGNFFRVESKDWVNVIALTSDKQVILIDQYRHGKHSYCLEIPGGIAEKNTILESAQAELREETGLVSDDWEYLGKVSANPAFMDNWCHTYIARDVYPHPNGQDLDESEQIEVYQYPLNKIPELLEKNILHHAMVVAAFGLFFLKHGTK
ncbi:NUDIX hydrolase [Leptospira sarikeiensis]|uniref:GDP-mannose pyrophosphatase n=1 Tax=Leptospira sarikeiensis TaxID=2484943 RepID=A0A4R9KEI0_9LEPT|nr:NUDIX hydrolase [Leptospira sarikeiensis]TGL64279.1 NUDIX hydrolase [Leptospira sarikeiensis]